MVKTDVGPRSRRSQAPNPDGSVDEGALAIPGVSALTRTVERVNHNLTTVAVVYTEALWDPEQALLPAAIGPGAVSLGTIRQVLHGPRYGGLPQVRSEERRWGKGGSVRVSHGGRLNLK